MGCICKKVLNILAGLALIGVAMNYLVYNVWLIVGVYLLLKGVLPLVCKCDAYCCTSMPAKKKR